MAERTRGDDCDDLFHYAVAAVGAALRDGEKNYPPQLSSDLHLAHARGHMLDLRESDPDDPEDHLTHLICRAVMAYALREGKA